VPRVSVVVPARDAEATLPRCLAALARQTDHDREVIVVDDGSSDSTASLAARAPGPVRLVRQSHAGAAAARNRGVAEARADRIAFTDADCFPAPDWLEHGVEALAGADIVQGRVDPEPVEPPLPFDRSLSVRRQSPFFETANLFVRRAVFERTGGFEAPLGDVGGRPFGEDLWFGWRARRAGARVAFSAEARVQHAVFRSSMRQYVAERSRRRLFPAMVARVPELRHDLCFARVFLDPRSAAFDAALAGALAAAAMQRPAPLAAAAPYAWLTLRDAVSWRRHGPERLAGSVAADAVGCAALALGSARARTAVL
jgi:glycosyltransferase involved in cell wall biosynthesis